MKKILLLISTTVMAIAMMVMLSSCSISNAFKIKYTLSDDSSYYIVTYGRFVNGHVNIPSTHLGKPVKEIGQEAFADCYDLTSVTIPSSVTSIGSSAFEWCNSLTSVTIPSSVTSIGGSAFACCYSLASVTIPSSVTSIGNSAFANCDSLASVTIPSSVTSIGNSAFANCDSLASVNIPSSVTSIGSYAFEYCDSLTAISISEANPNYKSIDGNLYSKDAKELIQYAIGKTDTSFTIPDGVTSIGSSAFEYCDNLTSVSIPNSVTNIGEWAFALCGSLTAISVSETNPNYKSIDGNLYSKDAKKLIQYAIGKTDTSFTIPDDVTSIGYATFAYCDSLTSVSIPSGVTSIRSYAFYGCSSLTSVTIPNSVTSIGGLAFWGCSSLTSVTIPNSVASIGGSAFWGCSSLTDVYYTESKENFAKIEIGSDNSALTNAKKHYNWSSSAGLEYTSNGNGTCYISGIGSCSDVDIVIPTESLEGDTIIGISNRAFEGCNTIKSITFPASVTEIGTFAFYNCTALSQVALPDGIAKIGEYAFRECTSLTDVYYVGTVADFEKIDIANGNSALTNATIHYSHITAYSDGLTFTSNGDGTCLVSGIESCEDTKIKIPKTSPTGDKVAGIKELAFYGNKNITAVIIPDGVTAIGEFAFYNCANLEYVILPKSVTRIDEKAFSGCTKLAKIYYEGSEEDFAKIIINTDDGSNENLTNAEIYYNNTL